MLCPGIHLPPPEHILSAVKIHQCHLTVKHQAHRRRWAGQSQQTRLVDVKSVSEQKGSQAGSNLSEPEAEDKSDEYTDVMQQRMGGVLTYRHEDGINYATMLDNLIVGSCLQRPEDVDRLAKDEGVGTILCLQEDSDMEWFSLDINPILQRCKERGDIEHVRFRIRDFDAFDLRLKLPEAVSIVAKHAKAGKKVYVHCTAGMGRAPATALAYMYWCRGFSLEEACTHFFARRPCNPRISAIRQATVDLLYDAGQRSAATIAMRRPFLASRFQVAGLDVGWGQTLDLAKEAGSHRYVLTRNLPPGTYPYKFVVDGRWTLSGDHPTLQDGDNVNNYLEVASISSNVEARSRLLSEAGTLTGEERAMLKARFC